MSEIDAEDQIRVNNDFDTSDKNKAAYTEDDDESDYLSDIDDVEVCNYIAITPILIPHCYTYCTYFACLGPYQFSLLASVTEKWSFCGFKRHCKTTRLLIILVLC